MSAVALETKSEVFTPSRQTLEPLPVMVKRFYSRNAEFVVQSSQYSLMDMGVSLHVGPLGLHLKPEESIALGHALIACGEHYLAALASEGETA